MRALLRQRWAARDQRGLAVMTGLVLYVGASSLGLVALLTMSFTSMRIAANQEHDAQQLRAVDGAMATAVVELQRDPKGTRSAPTGDGGCVNALGSDKDGALRVDDGMGDVVLVYASCWKGTEAGSADVRLRAVLDGVESAGTVVGTAWLSVRRSEDRQHVSVLDWNLRPDAEDPDPIPTTVPPTSVPPSTTTSTVPGAATWRLTVTSDWTVGYCADVVVTNPGPTSLTWVVTVPIDGVPYSLWSGTWAQDGDRLTVKGEHWNHTLAAGASTNFGFCADRPMSTTTTTTPAEQSATAIVRVTSDWTSGYCAEVSVTNPTRQRLDWVVTVPIEGSIYTFWNGEYGQDGDRLTVKGADWNRSLDAGASTSFGFCANR